MSGPSKSPFASSLADAIRAAVDTAKPEDRIFKREILRLDERYLVKLGPEVAAKRTAQNVSVAKDVRDTFLFNGN